jgi:hypothetical protein
VRRHARRSDRRDAEARQPEPGQPGQHRHRRRQSGKLVGASKVAAPPSTTRLPLTFEAYKYNGRAFLRWTINGRTFQSTVDSCSSRYFTATAGKSAIAIKFAPVQTVPQ